jgi:hypothetical protein
MLFGLNSITILSLDYCNIDLVVCPWAVKVDSNTAPTLFFAAPGRQRRRPSRALLRGDSSNLL